MYLLRIMKIQILLLRLAPGISVDTKCDRKFGIGIMCYLPDNVFGIEKKVQINSF